MFEVLQTEQFPSATCLKTNQNRKKEKERTPERNEGQVQYARNFTLNFNLHVILRHVEIKFHVKEERERVSQKKCEAKP